MNATLTDSQRRMSMGTFVDESTVRLGSGDTIYRVRCDQVDGAPYWQGTLIRGESCIPYVSRDGVLWQPSDLQFRCG